jgi:hypothetical protein
VKQANTQSSPQRRIASVAVEESTEYKLVLKVNPLASTAQQAAIAMLTLNSIVHLSVGLVKLESSQIAQDPAGAGIVNLANTEEAIFPMLLQMLQSEIPTVSPVLLVNTA